jgi:radical SAM protein with 4Fe4S-binding SPASM domain
MSLCRDNKDSIRETVKLMGELGCKYLKICNTSPQGEWKDQPEHYLKQTEAYQTFLDYIPQYFEDGKPCSIGLEGFFNCRDSKAGSDFVKYGKEEKFGKQLMCGEVRRTMYVSPTGNVLSCMPMIGTPIEDQFPNMLKIPLEEILDSDSLYMTFSNYRVSDYMAHNADCRECEYREMCCGGCRAVAINTSPDDYLGKDLNTCEFFRGGWKKKVDELLKSLGVETEEQKET